MPETSEGGGCASGSHSMVRVRLSVERGGGRSHGRQRGLVPKDDPPEAVTGPVLYKKCIGSLDRTVELI